MGLIFKLFNKNSLFILFIFLEILSLYFISTIDSYQSSVINKNLVNYSGNLNGQIQSVKNFFNLKAENDKLQEENKQLKLLYFNKRKVDKINYKLVKDTAKLSQIYSFFNAEVVSNSLNKQKNYFVINRGSNHGIKPDMGVLATNGVVGQVFNVSKNYSLVQSILNINTRINARLKSNSYFGTLIWDGKDSRLMTLVDIPKYVTVYEGDTVETDGKSSIYPEGIKIGKVVKKNVDKNWGSWELYVQLFEDMSHLNKVYVVNNLKKTQIKQLTDSIKQDAK